MPCGLSWGRGGEWEEDTLHWEAGRTLGVRGVLAPVTGRVRGAEAEWGPGQVLSPESGRRGAGWGELWAPTGRLRGRPEF